MNKWNISDEVKSNIKGFYYGLIGKVIAKDDLTCAVELIDSKIIYRIRENCLYESLKELP